MVTPISHNLGEGEKADWRSKVPQALADINAAIAEIDADLATAGGSPTNAELIAIMINVLNHQRTLLVDVRKMANLLVKLL